MSRGAPSANDTRCPSSGNLRLIIRLFAGSGSSGVSGPAVNAASDGLRWSPARDSRRMRRPPGLSISSSTHRFDVWISGGLIELKALATNSASRGSVAIGQERMQGRSIRFPWGELGCVPPSFPSFLSFVRFLIRCFVKYSIGQFCRDGFFERTEIGLCKKFEPQSPTASH
jgi:hypothetical protein